MKEARPVGGGEIGISGAERRMSGGIGAKKVDVTWATEGIRADLGYLGEVHYLKGYKNRELSKELS